MPCVMMSLNFYPGKIFIFPVQITVARFPVSLVKGGLVVEGSLWLRLLGFQHAALVLESGKTGGQEEPFMINRFNLRKRVTLVKDRQLAFGQGKWPVTCGSEDLPRVQVGPLSPFKADL